MRGEILSRAELAELGNLPAGVDCRRIRLYRDASGTSGLLRRIVLWASQNRSIALGNHVFLPDQSRGNLAVLAHELTHCGQYQAWGPVSYFAKGLVAQLQHLIHRTTGLGSSPYWYRIEPGKPFDAYGMEQQCQIVEDCFRGHSAARTISPFRPG